jgi:two-component system OmpR family sensor kinase
MTWLRSLGGRITLVTVAVAVLAVLVTGLISLQLVRASTLGDGKAQLVAQADVLAKLPETRRDTLGAREQAALGDTQVAFITPTGEVTGDAAGYVGPALAQRVLRQGRVSTSERVQGATVLIEGRSTRAGGGVVVARTQNSLEAATRDSARRIGLALVIGVAVAILAGVLLGRWLARPLVKVAATARRMAAGERGLPTPVHKPAEIADVSDALATLDSALTTSEGRQREFLLSISHELRTPLTAVRGYGEAMTDGLVKEADIAGVGATLVAETERLDRFVADLLELARLEADDFVIHPQPVDVGELLGQVHDAWQGRCSTLGVTMTVSAPAITITTDGRRVRQVIDGLVENALRVSPAGSTVTITAADHPATIEVTDGGPGLTGDDLAVAFDRGVLRDRYRDERPVGTGLGLSIASRLVARLGGTIGATNAPGAGARFTVTLPSAAGGS